MRHLLAVALIFAAGSALARADDEARKFDGTWEVKEGSIGGKADGKVKDITAVAFKDGVMSVKTATGSDDARFALNPAKTPAEITLTTARGNLSVPGIYKFEADGGELVIAFTQGDGGSRPKDFSGDGEKTVLLKLVRKMPARD